MRKEILTMYNGNKQKYRKALPQIHILDDMNSTAKAWIEKQTGLFLKPAGFLGYAAQPKRSQQVVRLLLTYNFKSRYYDNVDFKNVLMLKFARDEEWNKKGGIK